MTLAELAVGYREQDEALRERIREIRSLPARTQAELVRKRDRLRALDAMRRDVRSIAVICERYYDRSFYRGEKFCF